MGINGVLERALAGRWIAGAKIEDAIRESRELNRKGIGAIINYLGEEYKEEAAVRRSVQIYLELIKEMRLKKIKGDLTVKPTQIGLLLGKRKFLENYGKIVDFGKKNGVFVWFDMEEHWSVTDTISAYLSLVKRGNTGICIQACLKRSISDVKAIAKREGIIRLVKGAHKVPESGGYRDREKTTANYIKIMEYMFGHCKRFTVGTHDSMVIERAIGLNKIYKRDVTYAMLTGIRTNYALRLVGSGERVAIYVTFGEKWIGYSYRRLKELSNLKLIVRSLFGG